jgi:hypothetical protein
MKDDHALPGRLSNIGQFCALNIASQQQAQLRRPGQSAPQLVFYQMHVRRLVIGAEQQVMAPVVRVNLQTDGVLGQVEHILHPPADQQGAQFIDDGARR